MEMYARMLSVSKNSVLWLFKGQNPIICTETGLSE